AVGLSHRARPGLGVHRDAPGRARAAAGADPRRAGRGAGGVGGERRMSPLAPRAGPPGTRPPSRPAADPPATGPQPPAIRGRVLIVDDEEVLAATLQEFLSGEGYEVAVAHDAVGALALAERFEPDVALCDVQLPGDDGLELLDRLLLVRPETLVVMITAYAT